MLRLIQAICFIVLCVMVKGVVAQPKNNATYNKQLLDKKLTENGTIARQLLQKCSLGWCPKSQLPLDWQKLVSPVCKGGYVQKFVTEAELFPNIDNNVHISALQNSIDAEQNISLNGSVQVKQGAFVFKSHNASINPAKLSYKMQGNVKSYIGTDLNMEAGLINVAGIPNYTKGKLPIKNLQIQNGKLAIPKLHIRTQFNDLIIKENQNHKILLTNVAMSLCAPIDNSWKIESESLELNLKEGMGYSKHMWLYVYDVPIAYSPYLVFPIDGKRHTGFLSPIIYNHSLSGKGLVLPYYIDMLANMDATIFPHIIFDGNKDSFLLEGELRAMTANNNLELQAGSSIGPADDDTYSIYSLQYSLKKAVTVDINYAASNNANYFDYKSVLPIDRNKNNLLQNIKIAQTKKSWGWQVQTLAFQELKNTTNTEESYALYPEIKLYQNNHWQNGLHLNFMAKLTRFTKDKDDDNNLVQKDDVAIDRAVMQANMKLNLRNAWGFFIPQIIAYNRNYSSLDNITQDEKTYQDLAISYRLDTGLNFINDSAASSWALTFKPSLIAKYTQASSKQNDLLLLDSSIKSFGMDYINGNNLFNGLDRISDEQSIAWLINHEWLNKKYDWSINFLASQIYYAENRHVFANKNSATEIYTNKQNKSPLLLATVFDKDSHTFVWQAHIDPDNKNNNAKNNITYSSYGYNYLAGSSGLHLGYVNLFDGATQKVNNNYVQMAATYKLNPFWSIFAGNYNDKYVDEQNIPNRISNDFSGSIIYTDCCKQVALYYDRTDITDSADGKSNDSDNAIGISIALQLPTKNHTTSKAFDLVKKTIWGYE